MAISTPSGRGARAVMRRRGNPSALAVALALAAGQIALFLLIAPEIAKRDASDVTIKTIDIRPPQPLVPPPRPFETEPVPAEIEPGSPDQQAARPEPAPAPRLDLPRPIVRLDVDTAVAGPVALRNSSFDGVGVGFIEGNGGAGNGDGTDSGDGNGGAGDGGTGRQLFTEWGPDMRHDILHRFYPDEARKARVVGLARIDCQLLENEKVTDCKLLGQWPAEHGFGKAAMRAMPYYRLRQFDQYGARVFNERVIINARFTPRR